MECSTTKDGTGNCLADISTIMDAKEFALLLFFMLHRELLEIYQQFSVKINPLWYLDSERKRNLFFAKWILGVQFYNTDISHGIY
jgi:hypothetical protein